MGGVDVEAVPTYRAGGALYRRCVLRGRARQGLSSLLLNLARENKDGAAQ